MPRLAYSPQSGSCAARPWRLGLRAERCLITPATARPQLCQNEHLNSQGSPKGLFLTVTSPFPLIVDVTKLWKSLGYSYRSLLWHRLDPLQFLIVGCAKAVGPGGVWGSCCGWQSEVSYSPTQSLYSQSQDKGLWVAGTTGLPFLAQHRQPPVWFNQSKVGCSETLPSARSSKEAASSWLDFKVTQLIMSFQIKYNYTILETNINAL